MHKFTCWLWPKIMKKCAQKGKHIFKINPRPISNEVHMWCCTKLRSSLMLFFEHKHQHQAQRAQITLFLKSITRAYCLNLSICQRVTNTNFSSMKRASESPEAKKRLQLRGSIVIWNPSPGL